MSLEIYILDLIGTMAFAIYGSYFALRKDFDIFGIFVCAFLTAVGGGTIRETILNRPPFYFFDMNYIFVVALGITITIFAYNKFSSIQPFVLVLDSIGLVVFAFIGASKAHDLNLGTFAIIFFATITSVGGGILRDVVLNEISEIMRRDFYASVAVLLGIFYGLAGDSMKNVLLANLLICVCLAVRLLAVFFKINLWKPKKAMLKTMLQEEVGNGT